MKIAFLGIRGIPASYSGFETFVEQTAVRLVEKGHDVTVYNRRHHYNKVYEEYKGVKIITLPSIQNKHLDTIFHTFLSVIHSLFQKYDVVYFCGVGNSPLIFMLKIAGSKVIINVDGEDWAREKWGKFAQWYLRLTEKFACMFGDVVLADAVVIQERYKKLYGKETLYIPYGANIYYRPTNNQNNKTLKRYNLTRDEYIVFVARLEPENAAHILIEAFKSVKTDKKLVIVGDAPYNNKYMKALKESADNRVVFTGYVFGDGYKDLSQHAYIFVLPSGVDGTRPVLLDQMGFANCILARDSAANMEVLGESGIFFDKNNLIDDLSKQLSYLVNNPNQVKEYRHKAQERVMKKYSWDVATEKYDGLFRN